MNRLRGGMAFPFKFAFFFIMLLLLPASGCEKGPRQIAAPEDTPVDTEQFSKAKLTFKDEVVKDGHVILEKGKEYEFSGSFELTQVDDEAAEYKKFLGQVRSSLGVLLVIDSEKSGYDQPSPDKAHLKHAWVVDTYANRVPNTRFESPNIIHFNGRLKAPNQIGEQELRITFVPEDADVYVTILTRLVQVVEASVPKGT